MLVCTLVCTLDFSKRQSGLDGNDEFPKTLSIPQKCQYNKHIEAIRLRLLPQCLRLLYTDFLYARFVYHSRSHAIFCYHMLLKRILHTPLKHSISHTVKFYQNLSPISPSHNINPPSPFYNRHTTKHMTINPSG